MTNAIGHIRLDEATGYAVCPSTLPSDIVMLAAHMMVQAAPNLVTSRQAPANIAKKFLDYAQALYAEAGARKLAVDLPPPAGWEEVEL